MFFPFLQFDAERERMGASYFLRMFGNEIRYGDLHNFDLSHIKEKLNYLEWLIELANKHDFEVTKSMMFLDLTHVIPTAAGLPLRLEADGAATINVKVNGKMDIRRMFTSPSTFDISGSVAPSAALEITSTMGIDAVVAKTGLKMVTTLHTSTVAQGKFQLTEGKIFNLDWDIPQDKMEIVSAEYVHVSYPLGKCFLLIATSYQTGASSLSSGVMRIGNRICLTLASVHPMPSVRVVSSPPCLAWNYVESSPTHGTPAEPKYPSSPSLAPSAPRST